jgi:cobalt-zinc-cadmium efflux system outer membrane protein
MDTVADGPVAAEEADTRANRPASVVHTGDGVAQANANTHGKTSHGSAETDAEHRHTTLDEPPDADHQHQHTSDALHARPTLTLREALTRAVTQHPRLLANAYQLISQDARTEQAGARPDPTVNFLLENAFGTDVYEGVDATETTLGLTWLLEGERRQARVEVSSRLASKLATEARIQRLEVAAATANQFVDVLVFQALQQHTQRQLAQAEDALAVTQHQLDAGLASVVEVGLTQLDVARAQLAADDVEHELLVARHALAAQWGDTAPDFGVLEGTITQLPAPLPFDTLLSQIEASPLLSVYATERRVAEAQLKHADLTQQPQWELNANIRHFGLGDDLALVGGFNVTLPSKQRYNGRKAELIAEQARADANQQAHRTELTQTLYAQHSAMSHSLHVYDELAHKVLPTLERTLASARQQYAQGQLPYSDLRRLQQEYWLMRTETMQAAANAHRQKIAIERLTGAVLTTVSQEDASL